MVEEKIMGTHVLRDGSLISVEEILELMADNLTIEDLENLGVSLLRDEPELAGLFQSVCRFIGNRVNPRLSSHLPKSPL